MWLKRSEDWIKQNPGKGTMYKCVAETAEPDNLTALLAPVRKQYQKKPKKGLDSGIYAIICEQAKRAYIGQSECMGNRMRSHKMCITTDRAASQKNTYKKIRADYLLYGADSMQYVRLKTYLGATSDQLVEYETQTMFEYLAKGYQLYNSTPIGNVYVNPELLPLINTIIAKITQDPSIIPSITLLL